MQIINYGSNYEIYSDDLKTFGKLPAVTYQVEFHPMKGFWLSKIDDFQTIEAKIYGSHEEKIAKVLRSFKEFNRSMGIILSGNKGMGKSLFVQLLAQEAIATGMPVVMVKKAYKGVGEFIETIDQEVLVIFDEFEKIFSMDSNDHAESQQDLLGLFDGTSQKKRMYAITVNHIYKLSEFIVSRTGRFHYHIRFDYPTPTEVETYLKDKVDPQYHSQIKHVVGFSNRVKLNYDSLRAIAFELNLGCTFGEAIEDLNILTTDHQTYDVRVNLTNGKSIEIREQRLNLFSDYIQVTGYTPDTSNWFSLTFSGANIQNTIDDKMFVDGANIQVQTHQDDEENNEPFGVLSIGIKHKVDPGVNYRYTV